MINFTRLKKPGQRRFAYTLLLCFALASQPVLLAQTGYSDSTRNSRLQQMRNQVRMVELQYQARFQDRNTFNRQLQLFSAIRSSYQRAADYISRGIDTSRIEAGLYDIDSRLKQSLAVVLTNPPEIVSARDLSASNVLVRELTRQNERFHHRITDYFGQLQKLRSNIDSLITDSLLFYVPTDSVLQQDYVRRLTQMNMQFSLTDTIIDNDLRKMRELYGRSELQQLQLANYADNIAHTRTNLSHNIWNREAPNAYRRHSSSSTSSFKSQREVTRYSFSKTADLLVYYLRNHILVCFAFLVTVAGFCFYLHVLDRNIKKVMSGTDIAERYLSMRNPILTGIFLATVIGQFYFFYPPFIFYSIFWVVASIALSFIFHSFISRHWRHFWILFNLLFLVAVMVNNLLQATQNEVWFMMGVSVLGIALALYTLRPSEVVQLREKRLVFFLYLFLVLEIASIIALSFGRYNLGKAWFATGFFSLVVGIQLLWALRFLNEVFAISAEAFRDKEKRRFTIDFARVRGDAPQYLYAAVVFAWFVLIGRSFYIYQQITDPVGRFFTAQRTIGSYQFSFSNFLLFAVIILASALASRIVSYLADGQQRRNYANPSMRGGLGSWVLLIRITLIILGVFLAFAASGVPMDKIAIILGALSVGIGFGLQNLINNLVSGLIIAFEKPINVGDHVRIGTNEGVMKNIGFRSSLIGIADGSDVIIPNGELLNQHLINYDLTDLRRRGEMVFHFTYDTDINAVTQLVLQTARAHEHVLQNPAPSVLLQAFGDNAIEVKLWYWVEHPHSWAGVRSELMQHLLSEFKLHGISVPYQQLIIKRKKGEADAPPNLKS